MTRLRPLAGILLLLGTVFATLLGGMSASPAQAATCKPADPTLPYIVEGTLLNNGETPLPGVQVNLTGNGVDTCVLSDENGYFMLTVANPAKYTVSIETSTMPSGVGVEPADQASQEVDLTVTSDQGIIFPIGKVADTSVSIWAQLADRLFNGLNMGLLLALASIGISLIFGTTGFSNFAHGDMVSLGAMLTWFMTQILGWPILAAGALAIVAVGASAYLQDAAIWRPLRKRRLGLNQMMIVSIGFSIVFRYLILIFFGGETKDLGSTTEPVSWMAPITTTSTSLLGMGISAAALAGVALFLTRTRIGKATRAVSDNSSLAASTGIDVERIIRIVWILAGLLTGIAGVLWGLRYQANWSTGFDILLLLFASTTLGGLGTSLGTAVGALIIGLIVETSALVIPTDLTYASALFILILVLLVRPQGILGKKQRLG